MKNFLLAIFALLAVTCLFSLGEAEAALTSLAIVPAVGMMHPSQVEAEARERLSSYEGSYEGDENYLGDNDDDLSFSGNARSFVNEVGSSIKFGFKLQNTTTTTRVVALCPAFYSTASAINTATGETVDGILTDGNFVTDGTTYVTGTAHDAKHKIAPLLEFIKRNPARIVELTIQANNESAFEEKITMRQCSPFRAAGNEYITLTDYVKPDQYNTKKCIVPVWKDYPHTQLDDQNLILLPIGGTNVQATTGVILNITMKIGAILNPAGKLSKKAARAGKNIDRYRVAGVLKY